MSIVAAKDLMWIDKNKRNYDIKLESGVYVDLTANHVPKEE